MGKMIMKMYRSLDIIAFEKDAATEIDASAQSGGYSACHGLFRDSTKPSSEENHAGTQAKMGAQWRDQNEPLVQTDIVNVDQTLGKHSTVGGKVFRQQSV